jgi:hypothetical protein
MTSAKIARGHETDRHHSMQFPTYDDGSSQPRTA